MTQEFSPPSGARQLPQMLAEAQDLVQWAQESVPLEGTCSG